METCVSNKIRTTREAKVSIPIAGEEERSYGMSSESPKRILNIPILDSDTLKKILIGAASPIIVLAGGWYFIGMATSFILFPIRFILNFLSVLYSLLKFLF